MPTFKKEFGLEANGPNAYQDANLSANIVTTLQAGAVIGSLFAYTTADRIGRRMTLITGASIYLLGCALQLVANLGTANDFPLAAQFRPLTPADSVQGCLYAGRVIAGIATGLSSAVAPMYVSENAPKAIRGALATCFNLVIVTCLTIAFWINVR